MSKFETVMVAYSEKPELNSRQQRFVELVVSGVPNSRAYEQSGYTSRGNAAEVGASKLVRNAKVAQAIELEQIASRQRTDFKRDEKLAILADIARNVVAPSRERIAAIKVHNEMTGDDVVPPPERNGPAPLELIKERAWHVVSPLIRPHALA